MSLAVDLNLNYPFLRRNEASEYCQLHGLPVAISTLATYATKGGGPPYRKFGNTPVYSRKDLDAWIKSRLSHIR